jgi:membrane-associated phospholipid phosphatase
MNSNDRNLLIIITGLAVIAIVMSIYAHWFPRFPGDLNLTLLFQSIHSNILLSVLEWVSDLTTNWRSPVLVIVFSLFVYWRLGKREAILVIVAGISSLIGALVKILVDRPRPTDDLVHVFKILNEGSFPSGHAFFATVLFGLIAYFTFTRLRQPVLRMLIFCSLLILILMIGASRIYLGAHWLSDVMGGYIFGAVFLGIFIFIDRLLKQRDFNY